MLSFCARGNEAAQKIVKKRLEDSIASIQKSIALLCTTQISKHEERKHPVSNRKILMVSEESENKRPKGATVSLESHGEAVD